jgi:signal transduction histidine kinase
METNARPPTRLVIFQLAVILPTIGAGVVLLAQSRSSLSPWLDLLIWTAVIAIVEYLPIPAWHGLRVSMGFPLMLMVGIIYSPLSAGVTALVGSSDPREFRGEVHPLVAIFNRAQVALSVTIASAVFHGMADIRTSPTWILLIAAMAAALVDYLINSGIVTAYVTIQSGLSPRRVIADLRIGRLSEFLMSYLGLGALGLALAELFLEVKWWSLPTFFAPLLLARQMLFRSQALEEAHTELKEREQILKQLSNTIAEERHDEREQIANYLHDDLAQVLFRLSIQVDVARKQLERGEVTEVGGSLEKIRDAKQDTSDRIRALIRDLHRSPLGAKGLAEAIQSFTDEMGRDSGVAFHTDVADLQLPAPIALLVYHIAREGVMNALKHAHATDMWITVSEDAESIEFELRDNGQGFDTSAPGPEGHYGMAMMRGRATVGGGSLKVTSVPTEGTTITARFPISLLQQESDGAASNGEATDGAPEAGASPGTSGAVVQGDEHSPERVPTSS